MSYAADISAPKDGIYSSGRNRLIQYGTDLFQWAAPSGKLYKSTDGGATWSLAVTAPFLTDITGQLNNYGIASLGYKSYYLGVDPTVPLPANVKTVFGYIDLRDSSNHVLSNDASITTIVDYFHYSFGGYLGMFLGVESDNSIYAVIYTKEWSGTAVGVDVWYWNGAAWTLIYSYPNVPHTPLSPYAVIFVESVIVGSSGICHVLLSASTSGSSTTGASDLLYMALQSGAIVTVPTVVSASFMVGWTTNPFLCAPVQAGSDFYFGFSPVPSGVGNLSTAKFPDTTAGTFTFAVIEPAGWFLGMGPGNGSVIPKTGLGETALILYKSGTFYLIYSENSNFSSRPEPFALPPFGLDFYYRTSADGTTWSAKTKFFTFSNPAQDTMPCNFNGIYPLAGATVTDPLEISFLASGYSAAYVRWFLKLVVVPPVPPTLPGGGLVQGVQNGPFELFVWQPALIPKPELTLDRFGDWDQCGSPGNKFFQGLILTADTGGAAKSVKIRDSDAQALHVLQPAVVVHSGEQISPYSFETPFYAHSVRDEAQDMVPWRKFSARYIWEPAPESVRTWQTQPTSHGLQGFHHILRIEAAWVSSSPITLTITAYDGTSPAPIILPSTGGARARALFTLTPNKAQQFIYSATSASPFMVFLEDWIAWVGPWGRVSEYIPYRQFGGSFGEKATI